ncbi:uncharacterized protein si:ch1073-126c3.2 [Cololabis saira]|uniref:uncharacterized protein si:ch1073-126c3.2 n=1 Tax=Cololabis saira TaxID=129043 RepID=UPI002AD5AABA|nr:uncharacterized protein si:ch1073-126c3.2 [Cololabis saira]
MALRTTQTWLCWLAVLLFSGEEALSQKCQSDLLRNLTANLQKAVDCGLEPPADWEDKSTALLLMNMRNLTETLHKHQLAACQGAEPSQCHEAEVPRNGGLACATVAQKRYCKPLCNNGYDFSFLRRSRLFDECSEQTGFRWNSQYVGGNTLAVCNEAHISVAGASTAYFPKGQDCLKTKSNSLMRESILETFATDLKNQGVVGELQHRCLVCG